MLRITNRVALLLLAGLTLCAAGFTQSSQSSQSFTIPSVPAETHQLDSLLGHWTYVEDLHSPQNYKPTGTWTFTRSADGFMVSDEFRTDNGAGGTAVVAETYRAYNPATKAWSFQATIYQAPMIGQKNGEWDLGVTRVQNGEIYDEITKGDTISRVHFYNIKSDKFSCRFDTSNDGGKTWIKPVDIEATRTP
jgi:hypothetical protein